MPETRSLLHVKTKDLWIPKLRLRKLGCEKCGLMVEHSLWSVSGEGDDRYAFMHLLCGYCYQRTDMSLAHALKIEAYQQRKAGMSVHVPRKKQAA